VAIDAITAIPDEPRDKPPVIPTGRVEKVGRVGFRWRPETRAALQKASRAEGRSLSDFVERIVAEWLARNSADKRRGK
jgi:predicted HicB family RNase H-like nuclease